MLLWLSHMHLGFFNIPFIFVVALCVERKFGRPCVVAVIALMLSFWSEGWQLILYSPISCNFSQKSQV
jgi:hypothetical protein